MCGLTGFIIKRKGFPNNWNDILTKMANQIVHRGPDNDGVWYDIEEGVGLAHRRLAILDLSPHGHQPMISASGRFVIVYNGEVYNFRDIKDELLESGHRFSGHSDTEVMLSAIEQWGIKGATIRFNGMFAFAVWDRQEKTLHLPSNYNQTQI